MDKKHKHHDLIIAWANGAEIEFKSNSHGWIPCPNPCWNVDNESHYRIKPNKYQHLIDAYKQGKTIQYKSQDGEWYDIVYEYGLFEPHNDIEYRIKHKNQDVIDAYLRGETVQYYCINPSWNSGWLNVTNGCNLSVFDSGHEYRIKPNKHQHIIDAYKQGKTIQVKSQTGKWYDIAHTSFNSMCIENLFLDSIEYRVKHKYQDVIDAYVRGETVQYYCINPNWNSGWLNVTNGCNLSVFDSGHEYRIKPNKHQHLIDAWAKGAEIQWYDCISWRDTITPSWKEDLEYRIKPNKHQHLIDAYKEGKTIQYKALDDRWYDLDMKGVFYDDIEYRIKHKNQDVIDAYLRGETVQYYGINFEWYNGWLELPRGKNLDVFDDNYEFRIKPVPEYQKQIDNILENFDFEKVHKVMKYLNWEWCRNGEYSVPGLHELKPYARKLLNQVAEQVLQKSYPEYGTECGGFVVQAYKDEKNPDNVFLMLRFSLASWDNYE